MTPRYKWTDEADALLGTMPDTALGTKLGIDRDIVCNRRRKLGVQAFVKVLDLDKAIDEANNRQRRWQLANRLAGKCAACAGEPLVTKNHCKRCADKRKMGGKRK